MSGVQTRVLQTVEGMETVKVNAVYFCESCGHDEYDHAFMKDGRALCYGKQYNCKCKGFKLGGEIE